jgi:phospho-N-acetylmuramoyl-pentapeptide-transferase
MIALLLAASVAFLLSVFGTPFLIRVLRAREIGQTIRDDGPFKHPHMAKAGTPTMGGIAIVVSAFAGYVVAHIRTEQLKFARAGVTLMLLIVGLATVGFIDDYLGVRKHRNLGLRKRGKTSGMLAVAAGFASGAPLRGHLDEPVVHTSHRPGPRDVDLGGVGDLHHPRVGERREHHGRHGRPRRRRRHPRVLRAHGHASGIRHPAVRSIE